MSSTTVPPPQGSSPHAPPPSVRPSPTEFVRSLDDESKHVLLVALLRDAVALNGETGLIPIDDEDGRPFGYYVPPKAAEELYRRLGPQLTPDEEREIDRRMATHESAVPMQVFVADLKRQLADLQRPRS